MSTQPNEGGIAALSEAQVEALGGWQEVTTWLGWLKDKREFVAPLLKGYEEFMAAVTWRSRLAAIGGVMDAMGVVIDSAPDAVSVFVASSLSDGDESEFVVSVLADCQTQFEAMGINWGDLITKLPQFIGYIQVVAELLKRFRPPAGMMAAAVVIPPIHGLVYRPFSLAA
jgi:hypothetical protein